MKTDHKITVEIPEDLYAGIVDFRKKSRIRDAKSAVVELIKYALTLPPFRSFLIKRYGYSLRICNIHPCGLKTCRDIRTDGN